MNVEPSDRTFGIFAAILLIAVAILMGMQCGCQYGKPACAVVDIAHSACEWVTVEYLDDEGNTVRENVPKSELRSMAIRARASRGGK